jgi:hypothetical protein
MSAVELVADASVISYIFNECSLGRAYEDLIGSRSVGIMGQSIAELRAGVVMAKWGERRMAEHSRFLGRFTHSRDEVQHRRADRTGGCVAGGVRDVARRSARHA